MRGKRLLCLAAGLAAALALGLIAWKSVAGRNRERADRLLGNGTIEATEVDVSAKVAGKIVSLRVDEGDAVRAGDIIAVLDSDELEAQVEQAQGALRSAEATLAELRAGTRPEDIRRAQAQYDAALRALRQAQARRDLVRAGPRKEQVEQLRAAYRQAQARLSLVREGARKEQIEQLRAALAQAEVALADAETELRRMQGLEEQGAVSSQQVDRARTQRDLARTQVEAARQRLAEAQAGARPQEIREAEAVVEGARQRLAEAEAGARPQERREAEAAVQQAQEQVRAAKAVLDLALAGPRPETIEAARARVEQARGALKAAKALRDYCTVKSPVTGTVTLRNVELGELVTPRLPIVRVAMLDRMWLRVYVPEPDLGRVKLGQRADVMTDTYPGKRYRGRVIEISQEAEFTPKNVQTREERVKLVFGVKVEVQNPNHGLKPGMPADAVIHVGSRRPHGGDRDRR